MALAAAIRAVTDIFDFADLPYQLARPILIKIQSPSQLRAIEEKCPQVAEHSEELWKKFIARDIPNWEEKIVEPKNPNSWHKVYRYMQRQEEKKVAEDEEALRKALQGESLKKVNKETLFIDKVLPHARGEDETTYHIQGLLRKDFLKTQTRTTSLKNAKTGKEALAAIRRETAAARREKAMGKAMGKPLQAPKQAEQLANSRPQIKTAASEATLVGAKRPLVVAPRDILPHEKEMLADLERAGKDIKIQAPSRRGIEAVVKRNKEVVHAATQRARAENEAKLKAFSENQKRAPPVAQPAREFDFEPAAILTAEERASPPNICLVTKGISTRKAVGAASPTPQPKADNAASPNGARLPSPRSQANSSSANPPPADLSSVTPPAPSTSSQSIGAAPAGTPSVGAPSAATPPVGTPTAASPPPKLMKRRAPPSIFMNNKKRRV